MRHRSPSGNLSIIIITGVLLMIWRLRWHGYQLERYLLQKSRMYTYVYVYICWFNFVALARENAYDTKKEPINYRGTSVNQTHYLQNEATPPAPSTLVSYHRNCPKNTIPGQWHGQSSTGQLVYFLRINLYRKYVPQYQGYAKCKYIIMFQYISH